jgi:hypothetical protein
MYIAYCIVFIVTAQGGKFYNLVPADSTFNRCWKINYEEISCICRSVAYADQLHMQISCICRSVAHADQLHMQISCTCRSFAHADQLYMQISCICRSVAHADQLHMQISCICRSVAYAPTILSPSPKNTRRHTRNQVTPMCNFSYDANYEQVRKCAEDVTILARSFTRIYLENHQDLLKKHTHTHEVCFVCITKYVWNFSHFGKHRVIILSDNYWSPLPIGSFIILM